MQSEEKVRLLNCKDAAKYLSMTLPALRKKIFLRQLRGIVKIGGRVFLDKKKLDLFIDESEIPTNGGKR